MLEIIFRCLFAALAIFGAVELVRVFIFWLLKTDNPGTFYLVISFCGHDEQAETALRSAAERSKWIGGEVHIICVDRGMDEGTRRICEIICAENPEITLCTPLELKKYCKGFET